MSRRQIFLLAGEPSGDALGAELMRGLKRLTHDEVSFMGVGGDAMVREGLPPIFPMADLSVMGLAEVLPRLPRLLARINQTVTAIREMQPDAVITIDAPDFSFRVMKRLMLAGSRIPRIHYVAPTVWAWRPGRAKKIAAFLDRILCLFPFEPPWFEAEGLKAQFVGHPALAQSAASLDGPGFRARHKIPADAPLLAILYGSRRGEVSRLAAPFGQIVAGLKARHPDLHAVVVTVPHVAELARRAAHTLPVPATLVTGTGKWPAFAAADAALAASGTVTLELALASTPTVLCYMANPVSSRIAESLIATPWVGLANILLQDGLVPEFLQRNLKPPVVAAALDRLLTDPAARQAQIDGFAQLRQKLDAPADAAAQAVLAAIGR